MECTLVVDNEFFLHQSTVIQVMSLEFMVEDLCTFITLTSSWPGCWWGQGVWRSPSEQEKEEAEEIPV